MLQNLINRYSGQPCVAITLYSVFGLLIAISLLWLAINRGSRLGAFLQMPLLQAFGTLSYGIYMWHLPAKFVLYGFDKSIRPVDDLLQRHCL